MIREVARTKQIRTLFTRKENRIFKNALYLYASPLVMGLLGFAFWLVVARFVSAEEIGINTSLINLATVATTLSLLGLNSMIIRVLPGIKGKGVFIGTSSLIVVGSSVVTILIVYAFVRNNPVLAVDTWVFILMAALTIVVTLSTITDSYFISETKPQYPLIRNTIYAVVKIVFVGFILIWASKYNILSIWLAAVVGGLILSYYFMIRMKAYPFRVSSVPLKIIAANWRFGLSNYITHSLHHGTILLLPVLVTSLAGGTDGAYFYIPWMLAGQVYYASDSVAMSLFAEGSNNEATFLPQLKRCLKFVGLISLAGTIFLIAFGKYILWIFGSSYSTQGYSVLVMLAGASIPFSIVVLYKALLRVYKKTLELALVWIVLIGGSFIGAYILVPLYGIIAAADSWLYCNILVAIFILFRSYKLIVPFLRKVNHDKEKNNH